MTTETERRDFEERGPNDRAVVRLVQLRAANHSSTFGGFIDDIEETSGGATAILTDRFGHRYRIELKPL